MMKKVLGLMGISIYLVYATQSSTLLMTPKEGSYAGSLNTST